LGPLYGVPSVALFSHRSQFVSTHLDATELFVRALNEKGGRHANYGAIDVKLFDAVGFLS
jgi:hypothetical protein